MDSLLPRCGGEKEQGVHPCGCWRRDLPHGRIRAYPGDSSRRRPCLRFRAITEASGFVVFRSHLSAAPSGIVPSSVGDSWLSRARVR
jgi:hypothetical protein